jgi:hypothetical protein
MISGNDHRAAVPVCGLCLSVGLDSGSAIAAGGWRCEWEPHPLHVGGEFSSYDCEKSRHVRRSDLSAGEERP